MRLVSTSRGPRTLLLQLDATDTLPDALAVGLEVEGVAAGWVRASGALADVEVRAGDDVRRVPGPVMAVVIDGAAVAGAGSLVLRGVLSRDTGASIETFAGEIVRARVLSLDVVVTALEDGAPARKAPSPERAAATAAWSGAAEASARTPEPSPRPQPVLPRVEPMPAPPRPRHVETDVDQPFPEAGDVVEHFAFGRCEVLKSDGDRLHVRLARDGRVREIALEMLKVATLDPEGTQKRYRLDRKP